MSRHSTTHMQQIRTALAAYEANAFPLPGIVNAQNRAVFIRQMLDSIRRVQYVSVVASRHLSPDRANPHSDLFDPIKAALIHKATGNFDEAGWLVFLSVHFGKHRRSEWRLPREVYGKLGWAPYWTWNSMVADTDAFRNWLRDNQAELMRGRNRGFGNHRKYQSIDADKPVGTGIAIQSYVSWVMQYGGHAQLFAHALTQSQNDPKRAFEWLYNSMSEVVSFGRMAKFDYLTMLQKTGLAQIAPGFAYLEDSSGPTTGARLMLQGSLARELSLEEMENRLILLAQYINVGMQEIEDSLCNWQKSPATYKLFSG